MAEVALRDYLSEIDRLIEGGSNDTAIQHCRHILTQYPRCVEAYRVLGKALLEKEEDRAAQDVFERVLSVDPEDFVARVGLSIIHDRNNELDTAIWHMERAFDIAPSNELIQGELRRLYARRDGAAPERIALTRSALARMYTKGDLYEEAIADLRNLLREQPNRIDLQIQMAEALWRNEQRLDAIDWTQRATRQLPNCVKANLINGAVLRESGDISESEAVFKRVQAIDPENIYAEELFGPASLLPRQAVMISRLELRGTEELLMAAAPVAETEEVPEWLRGITGLEALETAEQETGESYEALPAGAQLPEAKPVSEVPDWLQGLSEPTAPAAEANVPDWLAALAGGAAAAAIVEHEQEREPKSEAEAAAELAAAEEVPDWLNRLAIATGPLGAPTGPLRADKTAVPPAEEEIPDWLAQIQEAPPPPFPTTTVGSLGVEPQEETPDWLEQLQAATPALDEHVEVGETPNWLKALASSEAEQTGEPSIETEALAAGLAAAGAAWWTQTGEEEAAEAETSLPAGGVQPEEMTAEAAAWAAFSEEEAEPVSLPPTAEVQPEEAAFEAAALSFAAPGAVEETAAEVPEAMPSADDALAFLARLAAGKEDQLRAQAQEEAEARMSEIMGRKPSEPKAAAAEPGVGAAAVVAGAAAVGAAAAREEVKKEEAKPVEPPAAALPVTAQAEVPEAMPSADDALAFLARLAAGKEDQLRAQAQEEAEARMSEIMGRKPSEPKPAEVKPAAEVPPVSAGPIAVSQPEELEEIPAAEEELAAATTPENELPDWLQAMRPTAESSEAGLSDFFLEEALAGETAEITPASELPDWLKTMQPSEASQPQPMAGELPGEIPAGLAAIFGEEEAPAELMGELAPSITPEVGALDFGVPAAAPVEVKPIGDWWVQFAADEGEEPYQLPTAQGKGALSLEWWVQSAQDTGEEPIGELPAIFSPPAPAEAKAEAAPKRTGPIIKPITGPLPKRQTAPFAGTPSTGPLPSESNLESLQSRLRANANDHGARLELARTYWATGKREEAYASYSQLANSSVFAKEIMIDLESITEIQDSADWQRLMGDVYMKAGRLTGALDRYRRALSSL